MTYISLAHRNSEIIVISDMDSFANYFCFAKKQKQGHLLDNVKIDEEAPTLDSIEPEGKALEDNSVIVPSSDVVDEEDDI